MARYQPKKSGFIAAVIVQGLFMTILIYCKLHPVWAWLIGINLTVFSFYGFDKRRAITNHGRIPEIVLHTLALLGGTPGAFAAQRLFRHKTQKISFALIFALIFFVQLAAVIYLWRYWH